MVAKEMKIYKAKDDILKLVLAEIHKSVQKPDAGFFTIDQWAERWGYAHVNTMRLIRIALKASIMTERNFRILTNGRVRMMKHYGKSKPLTKLKL